MNSPEAFQLESLSEKKERCGRIWENWEINSNIPSSKCYKVNLLQDLLEENVSIALYQSILYLLNCFSLYVESVNSSAGRLPHSEALDQP